MSEKDREGGQEPFAPSAVDQPRRGVSRRRVLQTGAAAGVALAWAVPAVEAFASGQAFAAVSPTTLPPTDFVLAVAFSALDPLQNNNEGYFWPLGVVVTSKFENGREVYTVNYLTTFSSGDDSSYCTVYGFTANNQFFAFRVEVPPANGGLSSYENGTPAPLGTAPAGFGGQITGDPYKGFGDLTLAPPSSSSDQKSAGFDASFDGSSLSINFYVDEVPEKEVPGANFPDVFIYQAKVFQPNSTLTGLDVATFTSIIASAPSQQILTYASSSDSPTVIYTAGTATNSSKATVKSLSYVFSNF